MKLKGGALFYSIVISIIIALLCSFVLLFRQHTDKFSEDVFSRSECIKDTYSAINYSLAQTENTSFTDFNLEHTRNKSILNKKEWGAYFIVTALTECRSFSYSRTALIGANIKEDIPVLYLADHDRPLSLCGNTRITGNVFVPKAGIKRAYIEGQNYSNDKLVYGNIFQSSSRLPEVNPSIFKFCAAVSGKTDQTFFDLIIPDAFFSDSVSNEFSEETKKILLAYHESYISGFLKGNIIISGSNKITISSKAELDQVIITAPFIKVEKGFRGSLQLIATDSLVIEEDCILEYPSFAGIIRLPGSMSKIHLQVDKNCKISGGIMGCNNSTSHIENCLISISEGTEITGLVYSDDYLEIKGKVIGTTYAKKIILRTASSVYENHLLNAELNVTDLHKSFLWPAVLKDSTNKHVTGILKWL